MTVRNWMSILAFMVLGLGIPYLVAHNLKLGDIAKSPQTVEIAMGGSVIVAGGKAKLWFAAIDLGPQIEIKCGKEAAFIELNGDEPSREVCGIRVRKIEIKEKEFRGGMVYRGKFEVTWDDKK
jgi:hypothetical protein